MTQASAIKQARGRADAQPVVIGAALAGLALVAIGGTAEGSSAIGLAALIGGAAGFSLYHAAFGFTAAWRQMIEERRGSGLRAQMLLFALACLVSYPLLAWGDRIGLAVAGSVVPMGVGSAAGAFLFGVGMMFGGSCASGTLFTSGGGSTRMLITLLFFVLGSVWGTRDFAWWADLPDFAPFGTVERLGAPLALAVTLAALALIYRASVLIERRAWGGLERSAPTGSLVFGPWSKTVGATAIAAVSVATLVVLHRPWGITSGFALWGGKGLAALGVPVETWPYWSGARHASLTEMSVFADPTSVMNFGIMLGAAAAAGLAGRFAPQARLGARDLATVVLGGLMMGYGARIAYGCNIGAYLGGIVSGSLSGWWWLVFGFAGSVTGSRLKRAAGL